MLAASLRAGTTRRVVAPGGMGKSHLLDLVAARLDAARIVRWSAAIDPEPPLLDEAVVLADDVHQASAEVIRSLARRAAGAVLAHRPFDGPVAELLDAVDCSPLLLEPCDHDGLRELVTTRPGAPPDTDVVDRLLGYTGGIARLALAVGAANPAGPTRALEHAIRTERRRLSSPAAALLPAAAVLPGLDLCLLAEICELDVGTAITATEELAAAGLSLDANGELLPAVAETVRRSLPSAQLRSLVDRAADLAMAGRGDVPATADKIRDLGVGGPAAARCLLQAAQTMPASESARSWIAATDNCELTPADRSAIRALVGFHRGDTGAAVIHADELLLQTSGRPSSALGREAVEAAAVVLARRGAWARCAELAAAAHPVGETGTELAVLGRLAIGDVAAARQAVDAFEGRSAAGMHAAAQLATARGLVATVADDPTPALPLLLEASRLFDLAGPRRWDVDGPHALAALVACQLCELEIAAEIVADAQRGGARVGQRTRDLLAAWIAMRRGDARSALAMAGRARDRGRAGSAHVELAVLAVETGVARRRGDLDTMSHAWRQARTVLLRVPPDLLLLQPVGELLIAGARLGDRGTVQTCLAAVRQLLARAGDPPVWTLWTRWDELQVAIALDDLSAARAAAKAAATLPWFAPRAAALAEAAVCWVDSLTGPADPDRVRAAARALADAGLTWEAARLAGGAAIRMSDSGQMRSLLQFARELSAPVVPVLGAEAGDLSPRERDVAAHLLAGLTYREIGAQLYIAPKTVEHHVARMRRRLGVESRAELLLALRRYVPSTAAS